MEIAFSSLWAVKALQTVCRYILQRRCVQYLPSCFELQVTFKIRRKKRVEAAILMVNLDHLEPATRTSMYNMYKACRLISSTIAVETTKYVWRVCCLAQLIMILYDVVRVRVRTRFHWRCHVKNTENKFIHTRA